MQENMVSDGGVPFELTGLDETNGFADGSRVLVVGPALGSDLSCLFDCVLKILPLVIPTFVANTSG